MIYSLYDLHTGARYIQVTPEQRENAVEALKFFKALPEHLFSPQLRAYQDGKARCLMGWLSQIPHFKLKGVSDHKGCPRDKHNGSMPSHKVFGISALANPQLPSEDCSTKQAVIKRLQLVIERTKV